MSTFKSARAFGKLAWALPLRHLFLRVSFSLASLALLAVGVRSTAQEVAQITTDQRTFIADMIAHGSQLLDIRVKAIRDGVLIRAIQEGSSTRHINILVDDPTPDLEDLVALHNVDIRVPASEGAGGPGRETLSNSTVTLDRGGGWVSVCSGPPVWERSAFGSEVELYGSSGAAPWESKTPTREFDRDFAAAVKLKMAPHRRSRIAVALAVVFGAVGMIVLVSRILRNRRHSSDA